MQHVLHEHTNQSSDAGVVENRLGGAGAEDAGGLQEDSGVHGGGEDANELSPTGRDSGEVENGTCEVGGQRGGDTKQILRLLRYG